MREEKKINYGINLLKIISMFFIIMVHILAHGGVLGSDLNTTQYIGCWILNLFCICGVDCFAMISGFVGYREEPKKIKFSRYIELWCQVVFYTVSITILALILGKFNIQFSYLFKSFFPVTFEFYWYFSAYTGLFFIMPMLNSIIRNMEHRELKNTLIICMFVFSFYGVISMRFADPFKIHSGYSMIWLILLYLVGAYIKKYNLCEKISIKNALKIMIVSVAFWIIWFFFIGKMLGHGADVLFNSYVSPIIIFISVSLLLIFGKMSLKEKPKQLIKFVTPTVFGIYLLHVNPIIFNNILGKRFGFISNYNIFIQIIMIIMIALCIFLIGFIVEKLRDMLFKIFHIRNFSETIEMKINYLIDKIQSTMKEV